MGDFPSGAHTASFRFLGNAHQVRLPFAQQRLPAPGAIDSSMTDQYKEILLGKDACLRVGHLVGASRTGEQPGLALTERACRICASTQVKELKPGPALLGQHMT